jgi:hypothetical protein
MRRIRIALTGTLGLLGDRLASRFEGDTGGRHLDSTQDLCIADDGRARAELGFAPRCSARDTLVEFARTRLLDAA